MELTRTGGSTAILSPPYLTPVLSDFPYHASEVPSRCCSDGCWALIYHHVKLNHVKLNPKFHKEWGQPISENNSPFERFFFLWPEGKLSRVHWGYALKTLWKLTHVCRDFFLESRILCLGNRKASATVKNGRNRKDPWACLERVLHNLMLFMFSKLR